MLVHRSAIALFVAAATVVAAPPTAHAQRAVVSDPHRDVTDGTREVGLPRDETTDIVRLTAAHTAVPRSCLLDDQDLATASVGALSSSRGTRHHDAAGSEGRVRTSIGGPVTRPLRAG